MLIRVAKMLLGGNAVSYKLFEFRDLWEPSLFFAGPDQLVVHTDLENTTAAWHQCRLAQFIRKRGQRR